MCDCYKLNQSQAQSCVIVISSTNHKLNQCVIGYKLNQSQAQSCVIGYKLNQSQAQSCVIVISSTNHKLNRVWLL